MADTAVAITAGTGTNIDTRTEGTNGNHRQVIVIGDPDTNAGVAPVSATQGLGVNVASGGIASGAIASGAVASGAIASGAFASGSIAAGAIAAGATSIAENEDVASADGDRGVKILFKRKDSPANASGTDGDYEQPQMSNGALWTQNIAIGHSVAVSVTRTNDTNAYAANDVIGSATGSTAALTFANMGRSAGVIMITSAELRIDASAVISGETSYRLHLYNVTPPSATGDNGAFDLPSGDRSSYLGFVELGTPVDLGSTLYVQTSNINRQMVLAGTNLFGYLVTIGAYTPTAQRVYTVTLHAIEV